MSRKNGDNSHNEGGVKSQTWYEKKKQRDAFKKHALDRRRYRIFNIDELNQIRSIVDETIEGKKAEFIEDLKKQKMELEKKIDELGG